MFHSLDSTTSCIKTIENKLDNHTTAYFFQVSILRHSAWYQIHLSKTTILTPESTNNKKGSSYEPSLNPVLARSWWPFWWPRALSTCRAGRRAQKCGGRGCRARRFAAQAPPGLRNNSPELRKLFWLFLVQIWDWILLQQQAG